MSSILEEIMQRFSACRDPASHSDYTLAGPFLCTKASLIHAQVSPLEPGEFRRTAGLVAIDEEALTCTRWSSAVQWDCLSSQTWHLPVNTDKASPNVGSLCDDWECLVCSQGLCKSNSCSASYHIFVLILKVKWNEISSFQILELVTTNLYFPSSKFLFKASITFIYKSFPIIFLKH